MKEKCKILSYLLRYSIAISITLLTLSYAQAYLSTPNGPLDIKIFFPLLSSIDTRDSEPIATPTPASTPSVPCPTIFGWRAEYWNNSKLEGAPALCRDDEEVGFDWALGAPAQSINPDAFSVRWTRTWQLPAGQYRFHTEADDAIRLFIDGKPIIDSWFDTTADRAWEADVELQAGNHEIKLDYFEGTGAARVNLWWEMLTEVSCPAITEWKAEYFNNRTLSGNAILCKNENDLTFDWGKESPDKTLSTDGFSARFSRTARFTSGRYRFFIKADDGVRFSIDNRLLVDQWNVRSRVDNTVDVNLSEGDHVVTLEYFEDVDDAYAQLRWETLSSGTPPSTGIVDPKCGLITDWRGEYYNNTAFSGDAVFCRNDAAVQFNWGTGSPGSGIGNDDFAVRWTRNMSFTKGVYKFKFGVDDGVRLYIDDKLLIDQWRLAGKQDYEVEAALDEGYHTILIEYMEGSGGAIIRFSWDRIDDVACPTLTSGWQGEYFANRTLGGKPIFCATTAQINFGWGKDSPSPLLNADSFSIRWTTKAIFNGDTYRFRARADEGVRVYLDNTSVISQWGTNGGVEHVASIPVTAGEHTVVVEYWDDTNDAGVIVTWQGSGDANTPLPPLPNTSGTPSAGATPVPGATPTPSSPAAGELPQAGKVYKLVNYLSGKVVGIGNQSTEYGNMTQSTWQNESWQKWEVLPITSGPEAGMYKIRSMHSGRCMSVYKNPLPRFDTSQKDRSEIVQYPCGTQPDTWELVPHLTGYALKLRHSGKYVSVSENRLDDGAPIVQFVYYQGGNQSFAFVDVNATPTATPTGSAPVLAPPVQGKTYKLTNVRSNKVLQPVNGSTDPATKLVQATWTGASTQKWTFTPAGGFDDGYFFIKNVGSNKCIETYTYRGTTKQGYPYIQNDCRYGVVQLFKPQAVQNDGFMIIDKLTPYALSVEKNSTDDNAFILQVSPHGGPSELFRIEETP